MTPIDAYDAWVTWQSTPWGRLRYRLVAHTLERVIGRLGGPCSILDVGGADGGDALPLARAGHQVTILDPAEPLLRRAADAAERDGVAGHLRTIAGDVDSLHDVALERTAPFDVVLCHNVLQYMAGTLSPVRSMVAALRVGGVISLLAPNPAMDVLAVAVRDLDPARAREVLGAGTVRSVSFGRDMRRIEAEEAEAALVACECAVTNRFGIRCVSDLIADNDLKANEPFAMVLEHLELDLYDREPYRRTARFWQLVATRSS